MNSHLVAYDICDPKRLRKVAKVCEDFGLRRQYSVFFCRLAAVDLVRLKSRLYDVIDLDQDQVLFVPLCSRCAAAIEALGRPVEAHDGAGCGDCEMIIDLNGATAACSRGMCLRPQQRIQSRSSFNGAARFGRGLRKLGPDS